MPADEYAAVKGGGTLKLKGAKVTKSKKKKKPRVLDDDKAIAALDAATEDKGKDGNNIQDESSSKRDDSEEREGNDEPAVYKTEAQRRFEEAKQQRLARLAEASPGSKHNLLKTHKERVEELNTYLSKLSEHHDMPKIGPG